MKHWSTGLTVMLEKTPGVPLINKFRDILLMEVDFNFGNRLLLGKRIVHQMEARQVVSSETLGSRKALCSIEVAVCRELFLCIVRQRKVNAALELYDAQSC